MSATTDLTTKIGEDVSAAVRRPTEWDHRLPETPEDVVNLLRRRIEVHTWWRDWTATGSEAAKAASGHGTGTVESHQRYINQYEAAIKVIEQHRPTSS